MDKATLMRLERLLKRFPETWMHTTEEEKVDGGTRIFHHVDYRTTMGVEGRPKVRLVSHVSPDMCELISCLKNNAPELIELARASLEADKDKPKQAIMTPRKNRKANDA